VNAYSNAANITGGDAADFNAGLLTTASSMAACTNDAECTTANEKCGSFLEEGFSFSDNTKGCVFQDVCNNLGKKNNNAFKIFCLDTVAGDNATDIVTELTNVELIVKSDD